MADISKVTIESTTYNLKDSAARTAISNINSFEYVVCSEASDTPYGVQIGDDDGTLNADLEYMHKIYLVPSLSGEAGKFESYLVVFDGNQYSWAKIGDTSSGVEVVRLTD